MKLASNVVGLMLFTAARTLLATESTLILVDGTRTAGRLVSISDRRVAAFEIGGKATPHPLLDIVRWGAVSDPRDHAAVVSLADGSHLVGEPTALDATTLSVSSATLGNVKLPRASVRRVHLDVRSSGGIAMDETVSTTSRPVGDRLKLANGDELVGTLTAWTEETIDVAVGPRKVALKSDAVVSASFAATRDTPAPRGPRYVLGLDDGSRLVVSEFSVEGAAVKATLAAGPAVAAKASQLRLVQPLGGRVTYLSDLRPQGYKHVPYLSLSWPYRADRNVTGGPLRGGGQTYLTGLGMHSAARLTYALDKPYRRFDAELAVDDATGGRGSVVFRVFTDDGAGKWQARHASQVIRGGDKPAPISVDVTGAKRLALVVDYADRGDEQDHANWLEARLIHEK